MNMFFPHRAPWRRRPGSSTRYRSSFEALNHTPSSLNTHFYGCSLIAYLFVCRKMSKASILIWLDGQPCATILLYSDFNMIQRRTYKAQECSNRPAKRSTL
ncbi:hypothetical protein K437DRAFT_27141 [Tilletiaria anomala UBC 951]|uniref:Uncharacterized protein n=1 Tax=Tilletiaria anomala (strain ATCC 24038 / CBS 436.72 / UBC 951) TaxID=1037660 RepID=A0A066VIB6_TILAU|nr:uncharacterized protein K437DRAFT_27141 [Tilletiaria anomala UBC 951]KDN38315.1 hypothetical protein K437DRAFT_27141 [Tilletiaria anomala UBC 951]